MALITPGELCNHTWRIDTICEPLWCTKHKCCHATWSLRVHITLEYADPVASEKEHDNPSHQKNPGRIQQKAIFAASSCSKPALESGLLDNLLATCPRSLEERGDHKWLKSCATAAWAVKLVHCETNDSDKSQAPADASFKQACRCRRGSSTRQNVATDSYAADSKPSTSRTAIHGTRIQQPHGIKRAREEQADTFNELYDMTSLTNAGKHATNEAQPRTRLDQQSALNYGERKLLKAFRECIEMSKVEDMRSVEVKRKKLEDEKTEFEVEKKEHEDERARVEMASQRSELESQENELERRSWNMEKGVLETKLQRLTCERDIYKAEAERLRAERR